MKHLWDLADDLLEHAGSVTLDLSGAPKMTVSLGEITKYIFNCHNLVTLVSSALKNASTRSATAKTLVQNAQQKSLPPLRETRTSAARGTRTLRVPIMLRALRQGIAQRSGFRKGPFLYPVFSF